jgi:mercuric ion binding protein
MKNIVLIAMLMLVGTTFAQDPKTKTVKIKTSAICEMCKDRIEDELNYTKGIVFAELNLENKVVTVKFKTKKLNQEIIKGIISKVGYSAGEVPANPKAYAELPKCCQSEGHCDD